MAMENLTQKIIDQYHDLDAKIFTSTRLLLLYLFQFYQSGLQFRELQEALKISDGKLFSNISILKELGMIEIEKIEVDNRLIDFINITQIGRDKLHEMKNWIKNLEELVKKIET